MDPFFLAFHHKHIFRNSSLIENYPLVQCFSLSSIMGLLQISHIDLWVLDVEGGEEMALRVRDTRRLTPLLFYRQRYNCQSHNSLSLLYLQEIVCSLFFSLLFAALGSGLPLDTYQRDSHGVLWVQQNQRGREETYPRDK